MKTDDYKSHNGSNVNSVESEAPNSNTHRPKRDPWRKPLTAIALVGLGAGIVVTGNYLLTGNPPLSWSFYPTAIATPTVPTISASQPTTTPTNFITQVVGKVGPTVVRIDATKTVRNSAPDVFNDPFFREFFGNQIPTPPSKEIVRGVGSGFIFNSNGEILTNAHVVNGADTVNVTLKDGRTFKGKVLGADPVTDVAVVKVQADNLPTVALGDSSALKPGEWAIAIGNPLGLDNTVTAGIVSATGRSSGAVGIPNERINFIQTDAAINPGNSGGPLLNAQGQVIGMNTAIIQGAQGLGFAIPIDTAKAIANQLVAKGTVEHPYLGIEMVTLTPDMQKQINHDPNSSLTVNRTQGALVVRVIPDSPAAKAGLRVGDVIDQINGQTMKDSNSVQQIVENSQVGNNLQVSLYRNSQSIKLAVKTASMPAPDQQISQPQSLP